MRLTFIRKTSESNETNCPALYRTDSGTYVVQGRRVFDPDVLAQAQDLGVDEVLVEVPGDVLSGVAEV